MLPSTILYQQREYALFFKILKYCRKQPSFFIGIASTPLPRKLHDEHNDTYCDHPKPSFWMSLPSRVIHMLKIGFS